MTLVIDELKKELTDQKQDLLTIATNLEFLSQDSGEDMLDIEGFDPAKAKTAHSVFRAVYTDANAQEANFYHNIVLACLKRLNTACRLLTAQDRLQRCSEDFVANLINACKQEDDALFHVLTENYVKLREVQDLYNKPDPVKLKSYADQHNAIFSYYQRYIQQPDAQRQRSAKDYERVHGGQKMAEDVWNLRLHYMAASLDENALVIDDAKKRLVVVATVRSAINEQTVESNPFTDEIIATNLRDCGERFRKASALHEGVDKAVGQTMTAYLANTHRQDKKTPCGYRALRLDMMPAITP